MVIVLPPYADPWGPSTATASSHPRYYYFAYGSNLWLKQMHVRCPEHTYVGKGVLKGYKWVISTRGYANVIPAGGEADPEERETYGVVYTLTTGDMASLDRYEGVSLIPPAYLKVTMDIEMYEDGGGAVLPCLVYVDPRLGLGVAHDEYVERINHGLKDAELPESWVKKVIRKWIPEEKAGEGVWG